MNYTKYKSQLHRRTLILFELPWASKAHLPLRQFSHASSPSDVFVLSICRIKSHRREDTVPFAKTQCHQGLNRAVE